MSIKNTYEDENGYLRFNDSNKLFHRWVMERKLDRPLKKGEIVHHINGNIKDNSDQNLIVLSPDQHYKLHIAPLMEARKEAQISEKLTLKIEAQAVKTVIIGFAILGAILFILGLITRSKLEIWHIGIAFLIAALIGWFLKWRSK